MEPEDWTDRMLTALQHGVKGTFFADKGWFSRYATHVSVRQSLCKVTH